MSLNSTASTPRITSTLFIFGSGLYRILRISTRDVTACLSIAVTRSPFRKPSSSDRLPAATFRQVSEPSNTGLGMASSIERSSSRSRSCACWVGSRAESCISARGYRRRCSPMNTRKCLPLAVSTFSDIVIQSLHRPTMRPLDQEF